MLEMDDLRGVLAEAAQLPNDMLLKERTQRVVELLYAYAEKRDVLKYADLVQFSLVHRSLQMQGFSRLIALSHAPIIPCFRQNVL